MRFIPTWSVGICETETNDAERWVSCGIGTQFCNICPEEALAYADKIRDMAALAQAMNDDRQRDKARRLSEAAQAKTKQENARHQ